MPPPSSPKVTHSRAVLGSAVAKYGHGHPEVARAYQAHAQAVAEAALDKRVDEIVAAWPKLSDEQVDRIAALLRVGKRNAS